MKTSVKKALFLEIILTLLSILNFFFPNIFSNNKYLILLAVTLITIYFMFGIDIRRNANDKRILRNMFIYILTYYLVIYILGLFVGFAKTIYKISFSNLLVNVIPSILLIVGMEIIRHELINKTNKNKFITYFSCIVFIIFEVSISFISYDLTYKDDIYHFFGLLLTGSITKNILMTIINSRTDIYPSIIYRFFIETFTFFLLIEPDLGPYLKSVSLILLPALTGIMVINTEKKQVIEGPEKKKKNSRFYIVVTAALAILVLLNSGVMKYQIMVIGSNSMVPYLEKGDVIFIDRLRKDDRKTVKENEILVYKYDNKIISHRVVEKLNRNPEVYYKTKGDANDQEDQIVISKEQVLGKVLFRIKYIGLPSVWLSDLFN